MEHRLVRTQTVDRNPFKRQSATSSSSLLPALLSKNQAPAGRGSRKWLSRVIGRVFRAQESQRSKSSLHLLNDSRCSLGSSW